MSGRRLFVVDRKAGGLADARHIYLDTTSIVQWRIFRFTCESGWQDKYFVGNVGGDLTSSKRLTVDEYMGLIVKPQNPTDEIGLLLLAGIYKLHICVFLEGRYWATNRNNLLNQDKIYVVYCGKLVFHNTTRKGCFHCSLMEVPQSKYNLIKPAKPQPVKHTEVKLPGRRTLNSMQAGL